MRVVEKRERMSSGIISAQNFSHWRGTSDVAANEVQSKIRSKEREQYFSDDNVCRNIQPDAYHERAPSTNLQDIIHEELNIETLYVDFG
jgi:hypothetical protein